MTANWTQEYTFDRYGNKLTTTKSGITANSAAVPLDGLPSQNYDQTSNRITDSGTEYDFSGNMTRGKAPDGSLQRFEFDEAGRIVVIKTDAGTAIETNTYATSRERLIKETATERTYYAWGGSSMIQEYTEGTGGTTGGSGSAGYSVNASPGSVAPGAAITINWTNPGGNTGSDWVGLYQVGAADTSFLTWQWAAAGTSGTNTISAPSTSGTYEIRYFTNNTYDKKATSGTIQVGSGGGGSSSTPFSWSKSYIYAGSRLLSTITNSSGTEVTEFHHPDRLGTKLVTNAANTTNKEQATLPFGTSLDAETSGTSGTGSSGNGAPSNQRFTSYDRSGATGLDYAVNRTYNSGQSRFTQVDPIGMASASIGDPQSLNLFAYTQNNPIDFVDPSGLLESGCSAEFSYGDCGGDSKFWGMMSGSPTYESGFGGGGGFGDDTAVRKQTLGDLPTHLQNSVSDYLNNVVYASPVVLGIIAIVYTWLGSDPGYIDHIPTNFTRFGALIREDGSTNIIECNNLGHGNCVDSPEPGNNDVTLDLLLALELPVGLIRTLGAAAVRGALNLATRALAGGTETVIANSTRGSTEIIAGIYEFTTANGKTYVGQSGDVLSRISQHIISGKLVEGTTVTIRRVGGDKTAREIAEQLRINELGGVKALENIRNPIGASRQYLMPQK
ncbi:MAG: RHS repeat-associated core domain-containing protein [Pyrinomonadaceae bacterium]